MKTIVITGASDGIGAEIARQLAGRDKAEVALVLAARNLEQLQQVAEACPVHKLLSGEIRIATQLGWEPAGQPT